CSSPPASSLFVLLSVFLPFHVPATAAFYTLSLHDALPICRGCSACSPRSRRRVRSRAGCSCTTSRSRPASRTRSPPRSSARTRPDRKSTRLNSSHVKISYAVFCLKKKRKDGAVQGGTAQSV